jgi:hypothetical protein
MIARLPKLFYSRSLRSSNTMLTLNTDVDHREVVQCIVPSSMEEEKSLSTGLASASARRLALKSLWHVCSHWYVDFLCIC